MAVDTPAKILILGAGPIGLEAALYARYLGYDVEVFDARESVMPHGMPASFLLPEPFGLCSSSLGLRALAAQNPEAALPAAEEQLTVGDWYERYVAPLAHSDLINDFLRLGTEVLSVGKVEITKADQPSGEYDRGAWDFRLLVKPRGESEQIAVGDVVLDCTGLSLPIPLGHGGIWAAGERSPELQSRLAYGVPDVLGSERSRYADRSVLVLGDHWQAAATVVALAQLARESPHTRVTLATRHERELRPHGPFVAASHDSPQRRQLFEAANRMAVDGAIEWLPETWVEKLEPAGTEDVRVHTAGATDAQYTFHQLVAGTGWRADWSCCQELQLDLCPVSDAARPLAEWLMQARWPAADTDTDTAAALLTSEPNYYVLGAKSFGRLPGFRYGHGLRQIREVFSILGDRPTLDLYS
jgi:hypothetical protein